MRPVHVAGIAAVVASLALADARPGAAQPAAGNYVRAATWEDTASVLPPGVWNQPSGIDLGASGRIYVVDRRLRRVEALDASGRSILSFGRGGTPDDLVAPEHLAVDEAHDRVYVADPGAGRIAVYTTTGAPVARWTTVPTPVGVAVAPNGRLVVTDADGDLVYVLGVDGAEVARWGGTGTGNAQYDAPAGLHVAVDGTVWVADRGNARLVGTDLAGRPVGLVRFTAPQVASASPLDVTAVDDWLWTVTDAGLARFPRTGTSHNLSALLAGVQAAALAADPIRGLFATVTPDGDYPGVWRYGPGQVSGDPKDRWGGPVLVPGYFDGLETVTIGDDGHAWLLDVPPRIQRLSLSGVVVGQLLAPDPVEVDADAAGQVFTAAGDMVYAWATDGSERWKARVRPPGAGVDVDLVGVAWDAVHGRLVVLDAGSRGCFSFDPAGKAIDDWSPRARDMSAMYWSDMAMGADGTLYLLDAGNGQVRGWDGYNRLTLEVNVPPGPTRFDVAADGTLVLLYGDGWARRIGRDGAILAEWDVTRLDRGRGSRPVDIAADGTGRVYVVDAVADIVTVYDWDPGAPNTAPPTVTEGCEVTGDKHAAPSEIALGDSIEVTLVVRGACAGSRQQADIALSIDTTLDRSQLQAARAAAEHFIGLVDPSADRVAVQPGGNGGRLTNDIQLMRRFVRRIETSETFDVGAAITDAEGELFTRRGRTGAKKVLILLFGSQRDADTEYWRWYWIQRAAGQAKRRGVEIFAIAFGRNADVQLLYDIASGRDHVYQSRGAWQLDALYARIAGEIKPTVLLEELVLTDEIPVNMDYVPGSAAPPATLRDRVLTWRFDQVPLAGVGVRYRLTPREPGDWPTNVRAEATYTSADGKAGRLDFPVPMVRVRAPTPVPTATAPPTATPTDTRVPSATVPPPPTATARPSPTATPASWSLYLPLLLRERCDATKRRADVVLVIDASTSMGEPTSLGRSKLEAATEAAMTFIDDLDLGRDRAGLVTFNAADTTLQVLTDDRAALVAALGRISMARSSRLDLGVAAARIELASPRHRADSQAAMIVLTDGRANPVGPEAAVAEAELAKRAGMSVFTVGVGDDLDLAALVAIASQPSYFYRTPDAEGLSAIYAEIAASIPCPASAFWGRRQ